MRRCLDLASISYENEEVPIGAVLTLKNKISGTGMKVFTAVWWHMQNLQADIVMPWIWLTT